MAAASSEEPLVVLDEAVTLLANLGQPELDAPPRMPWQSTCLPMHESWQSVPASCCARVTPCPQSLLRDLYSRMPLRLTIYAKSNRAERFERMMSGQLNQLNKLDGIARGAVALGADTSASLLIGHVASKRREVERARTAPALQTTTLSRCQEASESCGRDDDYVD